MALDLCQNFVSNQYLEDNQTLYNYLYWQDLVWDLLAVIFRKFVRELWPLIYVRK